MITFFIILGVLLLICIGGIMMGIFGCEDKLSGFEPLFVVPAVISIIVFFIILICWVCNYAHTTNYLVMTKARIATISSYKNQDGVWFLNKNTVTESEYNFALYYNQWLASEKYWNKQPYYDAFTPDAVEKEQPIQFITGDKAK